MNLMRQGSVYTTVDATPELIWQALNDKIEVPRFNFPAPTEIKILQRFGDALVRERVTNGERIAESVTVDNAARKITYTLVGHPVYEGYICHQLLLSGYSETERCILAFTVDWRVKDTEERPVARDMFESTNDDLFFLCELVERQALGLSVPGLRSDAGSDKIDLQ